SAASASSAKGPASKLRNERQPRCGSATARLLLFDPAAREWVRVRLFGEHGRPTRARRALRNEHKLTRRGTQHPIHTIDHSDSPAAGKTAPNLLHLRGAAAFRRARGFVVRDRRL